MANLASNFKINGDRLWETIMDMAKIGPGIAGGNNRQTLTDEDARGRALFQNGVMKQIYQWELTKWVPCLLVEKELILMHFLFM